MSQFYIPQMSRPFPHQLCFLFLGCILSSTDGSKWSHLVATLNRSSFPDGFFFGAATSAYQIEGAAFEDGKGASIWDKFTHTDEDKITDHSNGDVAADFYHLYKEDIVMMNKSGMDALRISISWPRILPKGKLSGGVNSLGVQFYNDLINQLLANGLQPYVTLYHWDLPQALEDEYGGFLSPNIVGDYLDYVNFCFGAFGDRVKNWITFNEPYAICIPGYATGDTAPGRCSDYEGNCTAGDSATEPYIVAHNLILSHAAGVKLYREKYKASQKGQIGIVLHFSWFEPFFQNGANQDAVRREMDFTAGWFLHPLTYGDYPENMKTLVGKRLPEFNMTESQMIKKSYDFLGVNYYTSFYTANAVFLEHFNLSASTDSRAIYTGWKNGFPIGQPTGYDWEFSCPEGIRSVLLYIKHNYNNPVIVITENGYPQPNSNTITVEEARSDELRISYHHSHLVYLLKSIEDGVNVRGYLLWSFLDDFEWNFGYSVSYGIVYVDFTDGLKRYPKDSYIWYSEFLNERNVISIPWASNASGALSL